MKHSVLIISLMIFISFTQAQTIGINDMFIIPAEPNTEDLVELVVYAVLPLAPCQLDTDETIVVEMDNDIKVITQYWTGFFASLCITADTIQLGYFSDGNYHLTCNYEFGVYTDTDSLTFTIGTPTNIGGNEIVENAIRLYPNPTNDMVTVTMEHASPYEVDIEIYDALGKLVANPNLVYKTFGEQTVSLNVSHLSKGLYLMKISVGDKNTTTKRFIKQ